MTTLRTDGHGYGYGDGCGYGIGCGYGNGCGYGYGYVDGYGYGDGHGHGYGYDDDDHGNYPLITDDPLVALAMITTTSPSPVVPS